ncbi:MAG: 5-formyltetrahydrofolate cyclo-ligase [Rhodocyclaceae bacterium]
MVTDTLDRRPLRERLIAEREALDPVARRRLTAAIASHVDRLLWTLQPSTLGFCWPFRGEPDLRELLTRWAAGTSNRQLALPVVTAADQPLLFRHWAPGAPLVPDRYGIPHPASGASVRPDVLLVPVNGFDSRGYRIGYGGGYFDRTLAALQPAPVTVGVGFELARLAKVAEAAHDRPLDWVVTEAGCVVQPRK